MDFIINNIGWFILATSITVIFLYKYFLGNRAALTAKYTSVIDIPERDNNLNQKVLSALEKSGFKKIGFNSNESTFYAQTKFSFWSFGENIQVIIQGEEGHSRLVFKSICTLPTQLTAYGKNKRNSAKFARNFQQEV
jgi:hypothetical protein